MAFLANRPQIVVAALIAITMTGFITGVRHYANEAKIQTAYDTAKSFENSITALHQYYSKEIEPRARAAGVEFAIDFMDYPDQLPYPAAVSIEFGHTLRAVNPALSTKIYSVAPFPNRLDRVLDDFEVESLAALLKDPDTDFFRIEQRDGKEFARYARALKMEATCVECHNRPEFGFEGRWKVGEVRGARQVTLPVPNLTPFIDRATNVAIWIAVASSLLGGLLVWPVVVRLRQSLSREEAASAGLRGANQELEEANRAKDALFSIVAHDLRSPLTGIIGITRWIAGAGQKLSKEALVDYASDIKEEGEKTLDFLDTMLKWSNDQMDGISLNPKTFALRDLAEECVALVSATTYQKAIYIDLAVGPEKAFADRELANLILRNLISNAIKFTPGGGEIALSSRSEGDQVYFAVRDTGVGLDEDEIEILLGAGRNFTKNGTDGEVGTGLGLELCSEMIARYDGTLSITSEPGKGATFEFSLPAANQ